MRDSGLEEGRGEDRTPSRHTLNSLSLSLSLPLLPSAGRSSNVSRRHRRRAMFLAPFQPRLLSYLRHAASPHAINLPSAGWRTTQCLGFLLN